MEATVHEPTIECNVCGSATDCEPPALVKDGFALIRCEHCRLLFRRDMPDASDLEDVYGSDYFSQADASTADPQSYLDYVGDEDAHRLTARARLRRLGKRGIRPPGTAVDVGAAAGFFLEEARQEGWEVLGIDVADSMTSHARDALRLDVRTGQFAADVFARDSASLLTMWDYIEHSLDPAADVNAAWAALAPGGWLALSTGNVESPLARVSRSRWHLLTPRHHNFYFSPATIRLLLTRAGFADIAVRHVGSPYSVRYCLHKLGTMVPSSSVARMTQRAGDSRLGDRAFPINLGDIMEVVARKPL